MDQVSGSYFGHLAQCIRLLSNVRELEAAGFKVAEGACIRNAIDNVSEDEYASFYAQACVYMVGLRFARNAHFVWCWPKRLSLVNAADESKGQIVVDEFRRDWCEQLTCVLQ